MEPIIDYPLTVVLRGRRRSWSSSVVVVRRRPWLVGWIKLYSNFLRDKLYKLIPDSKSVAEAVAINGREFLVTGLLQVVKILRLYRFLSIISTTRQFSDYFRGFDKVEAVRRIFGDKTEQVLRDLKVEFLWAGGYMGVNSANGHLMASPKYLNKGDKTDIYLDVIHELVHVKQFMEGKDLFDTHYSYTERPTEIEAYRYAVKEARRLGLSDARICEYLKTEWMSEEELKQLASTLNVHCKQVQNMQKQGTSKPDS